MNSLKKEKRTAQLFAAILLLIVFFAGSVVGAFLLRVVDSENKPSEQNHVLHVPLRALKLSKDQETKAHAIGEKYRSELDSVRLKILPEVLNIHKKMQNELKAILTPEQLKIHNRLHKEREENPETEMGPPHHHGRMRGPMGHKPPPEAKSACENLILGSKCSFRGRLGKKIQGICRIPPNKNHQICIPASH
jgi:hypothetical protein